MERIVKIVNSDQRIAVTNSRDNALLLIANGYQVISVPQDFGVHKGCWVLCTEKRYGESEPFSEVPETMVEECERVLRKATQEAVRDYNAIATLQIGESHDS